MSGGSQYQLSPASCKAAKGWMPCPMAAYLQPACTQLKVLQALQRRKLGRQAAARQLSTVEHEAVQALHRVRQRRAGRRVSCQAQQQPRPQATSCARCILHAQCAQRKTHACLG